MYWRKSNLQTIKIFLFNFNIENFHFNKMEWQFWKQIIPKHTSAIIGREA